MDALATKLLEEDLEASLRFIFDTDEGAVTRPDGTIDYQALVQHLAGVVAGPAAQEPPADGTGGTEAGVDQTDRSGRLGPPNVVVFEARGSMTIEDGASVLGR